MRREVRIAGFGGQGVIKAALLVALAAGLGEDKEVAQTQSYGPEARGGACRSDVVISDTVIEYIKPINLDMFVVMSQPAMDKYGAELDLGRVTIIADATLVTDVPAGAKNICRITATAEAERAFGSALYANIIILGAVAAVSDLVGLHALENALEGNVPPKTLETNRAALKLGYEMGIQSLKK